MTKRPIRSETQFIATSQADPDIRKFRNVFGWDDAAAAVGIAATAASAGKKVYNYFKPKVPITVTFLDSISASNERRIEFSIQNLSQHTVYIDSIAVGGIDKIALFKLDLDQAGGEIDISNLGGRLIADGTNKSGQRGYADKERAIVAELPIKLVGDKGLGLRMQFELAQSAQLKKEPVRKLKIGYCWISEAKPNDVLEIPFAIR